MVHDDEFEPDARDVDWLQAVGKRGWVVLTKGARIRTNALERGTLLSANVAAFMLGRGDMKGPQMAAAFIAALPRMTKALRRSDVPIIATVTAAGGVSVLYASGVRLRPARLVKLTGEECEDGRCGGWRIRVTLPISRPPRPCTSTSHRLELVVAQKRDDVGVCRLCGVHGLLLQSHIVSKAAYRRILLGPDIEVPKRQPVKVTPNASVLTNEQWTERLLCRVCEQRFGNWERYAFPLLSQADGTFPWLAGSTHLGGRAAHSPKAVDATKVSLFAASLLWRLSVSGRSTSLGPYESEFRNYLRVDGTPFPERSRLVITLLDHSRVTYGRVELSLHVGGPESKVIGSIGS